MFKDSSTKFNYYVHFIFIIRNKFNDYIAICYMKLLRCVTDIFKSKSYRLSIFSKFIIYSVQGCATLWI